jgi:hypothetical protein
MSDNGRVTIEGIAKAIETVSRWSLRDEQNDTIERLNALTSLDWTVEAEALPGETATDMCAHGDGCGFCGGHGRATCYFPDAEDGLCPSEAIRVITAGLVDGSYVSVDVVL